MSFPGSVYEYCLCCRCNVKPSYSFCPECEFYWGNTGKAKLSKILKRHKQKCKKLGKPVGGV